jgi:hypothetical protein
MQCQNPEMCRRFITQTFLFISAVRHFKNRGLSSIFNGIFLKSVYNKSKAHIRDLVRTDRTLIGRKIPEDLSCSTPQAILSEE